MKACKKEYYDEDLGVICNTNHSDFDKEQLRVQLQLLGDNLDVVTADGAMNIFHNFQFLRVFWSWERDRRWFVIQRLRYDFGDYSTKLDSTGNNDIVSDNEGQTVTFTRCSGNWKFL